MALLKFRLNSWPVMTDSRPVQEQHPLLCDDCSDEEFHIQDSSPKFHRRFRHSASSGRARTHALGAAHILTKWPDDLSSLLKYWWIVLGMFAFFVFLIYNSFLAVAELPMAHRLLSIDTKLATENKSTENPSLPNVYMHVFVANYEEFKSNDYIPYIEKIAKQYANFKYNFLVVLNDSTKDAVSDISDVRKNEMALNLLWTDNEEISERKEKLNENPLVKYISLTEYMDNSPLKKYWRLLPDQFIGFLARCIAVWDKGGVAFNPLILTPNTPNSAYLEKLHSVLGHFPMQNKPTSKQKPKTLKKFKKKMNNIRDIIMELEEGENTNINTFPDSLSEAESIPNIALTSFKVKRNTKTSYHQDTTGHKLTEGVKDGVWLKDNSDKGIKRKSVSFDKPIKTFNSTKASDIEAAQKILPKILDFFFHLNFKNLTSSLENSENITKNAELPEKHLSNFSLNKDSKSETDSVVDKSSSKSKYFTNKGFNRNESTNLITIDLKGNLIASGIACHAFIGTVFSNMYHHTDDEPLRDFIINELSLFCKGSLSTCDNVEVVLL